MKKVHKTIALAIAIAIALGILALLMPTAASASTADDETITPITSLLLNVAH